MALTREQLAQLVAAFPARGVRRSDPRGHEDLRSSIIAAIEPVAEALDFELETVDTLTQAQLEPLPAHIFLVWCEVDELMAYFYAVPEADLHEGIAQALAMIAGSQFAKPEALAPEQWGAALRLMAAVATPYARDVDDFFATFVAPHQPAPPALPDIAEVEALFDSFANCFVASGAGLGHRFSRVITIVRGSL